LEWQRHVHTPVGLRTATLGVLLLRDPLQFSLAAMHCQLPWCAAGRHCSSLAGNRSCVPAGGTSTQPSFHLS